MNANLTAKRCENWGGNRWAGMCLAPAVARRTINGRLSHLCAECDRREPKEDER